MERVVIYVLICLLLTGCWDRKEINDVAFVVGTGIDWKEDKFLVSVQIPLVGAMGGQSGGGGGTSGDKTWLVESASGTTIREANQEKQKSLSRVLDFSHRRVVIIGEEMAKEGVTDVFDVLSRGQDNRLTSFIVVSKGMARDVLNVDAPIEQYPSEMIRELTLGVTKEPLFIKTFMFHLIEEGLDPYAPVITYAETEPGDKGESATIIKLEGLAIFKGDKLVKLLNDEEGRSVLISNNQANLPTVQISSPNKTGELAVQLQQYHATITPKVKDKQITMTVNVTGKAVVMENTSDFHMRNAENKKEIEKAVEKKLKRDMEATIKELQSLGADPIGFGEKLKRDLSSDWKQIRDEWADLYPTVNVIVNANIHIEHEGVLSKPLKE